MQFWVGLLEFRVRLVILRLAVSVLDGGVRAATEDRRLQQRSSYGVKI